MIFEIFATLTKLVLQGVTFTMTHICISYFKSKSPGMETKLDLVTTDLVRLLNIQSSTATIIIFFGNFFAPVDAKYARVISLFSSSVFMMGTIQLFVVSVTHLVSILSSGILHSIYDKTFKVSVRIFVLVVNSTIMIWTELAVGGIGLKNHFAFMVNVDASDITSGQSSRIGALLFVVDFVLMLLTFAVAVHKNKKLKAQATIGEFYQRTYRKPSDLIVPNIELPLPGLIEDIFEQNRRLSLNSKPPEQDALPKNFRLKTYKIVLIFMTTLLALMIVTLLTRNRGDRVQVNLTAITMHVVFCIVLPFILIHRNKNLSGYAQAKLETWAETLRKFCLR